MSKKIKISFFAFLGIKTRFFGSQKLPKKCNIDPPAWKNQHFLPFEAKTDRSSGPFSVVESRPPLKWQNTGDWYINIFKICYAA